MAFGVALVIFIITTLTCSNSILHFPGSDHLKFPQAILVTYIHENANFTTLLQGDQLGVGKLECWTKVVYSYNEAEYFAENEVCRNDEEIFGANKTLEVLRNSNYFWNVDVKEAKEGQRFTPVTLWTSSSTSFLNLVLTTCCQQPFQSDNIDDYYLASFLLIAYLTPLYPMSTLRDVVSNERSYSEHAGEAAPCACDMTNGHCDTNCCCDKDCESHTPLPFDCCPGLKCGVSTEDLLDWRCNLGVYSPASDLHSILCIEWDNSPFLGYYFHDYSKISDLSSLNNVLQQSKASSSKFTWKDISDTSRLLKHIPDNTMYHYGQALQLFFNDNGKIRFEPLLLPFSIYSSKCTDAYSVSYLRPFKTQCNLLVRELCTLPDFAFSVLSAETFILGTSASDDGYPQLLRSPHSNEVAEVNVIYLCASNLDSSVISSNNQLTGFVSSSQNINILNSSCAFERLANASEPVTYFRADVCYNVAIDVLYDFFWQGGQILAVNITIILADIAVGHHGSEKPFHSLELAQQISVSFHYLSELNSLNKENETVYRRSGNPGYEFGYPVLAALSAESVDNEFLNDTWNFTAQLGPYLNIWMPVGSGFCESALTQPVLFGENILSGCLFRTTLRDFSNCTTLRDRIEAIQKQLVVAEYISRVGDPDLLNTEDFVPLLREKVETNDSKQDKEDLAPWQQWLKSQAISCTNIPAHMDVDIIYAERGHLGTHSVRTIVGTKMSFHGNTWFWNCWPGCHNDTRQVELIFPITSAVHFKIFKKPIPQVSRYWYREGIHFCQSETCWEEILYPITEVFHSDPLSKALFYFLLIGCYVVPWLYLSTNSYFPS